MLPRQPHDLCDVVDHHLVHIHVCLYDPLQPDEAIRIEHGSHIFGRVVLLPLDAPLQDAAFLFLVSRISRPEPEQESVQLCLG